MIFLVILHFPQFVKWKNGRVWSGGSVPKILRMNTQCPDVKTPVPKTAAGIVPILQRSPAKETIDTLYNKKIHR